MELVSLLIFFCVCAADAYKILIIHPTPSFSHQQPVVILTEALVKKGHEVFVVSPNKVPGLEKNYTYVDMSWAYEYFNPEKETSKDNMNLQKQLSKWDITKALKQFAYIPVRQFQSEEFLQFQRRVKEEKIEFDVVIGESHYVPFSCGMSRYLSSGVDGKGGGKPLIAISTLPADFLTEENIAGKVHLSYVPSLMDAYTDQMTIFQKLSNWAFFNVAMFVYTWMVDSMAKEFFRKSYGPEFESLVDGCWSNVSLSMISSSFLYTYPRPIAPNIVQLGPLHIRTPEKLPKILQEWLDGAEKGVIYFSLGSNMKSKSLPDDVRDNFLQCFKELPPGYRVLWKWELDGKIPGQSDNILAHQWLPQQSVLAHPKVRVFITHGGQQSFQEAVHYGVPTVGIPWWADQEAQVAKMAAAKVGVPLRPQELHSHHNIKSAVETVLFDQSYSSNMKKLSAISRELTPNAVDKAVFWVEHVARYGGAHLRPSSANTSYFQFFCLDILSVILVLGSAVIYVLVKMFKYLVYNLCSKSGSKIKRS